MCDVGIIRTYISDHHAISCVLDTVIPVPQHNNEQNIIIKRNLCDRNVNTLSRISQMRHGTLFMKGMRRRHSCGFKD